MKELNKMNLEIRYYIPLPEGSEDLETACIFHTPFKTRSHAISYAKGKLKSIAKNVRNWKLDEEYLEEQIESLKKN